MELVSNSTMGTSTRRNQRGVKGLEDSMFLEGERSVRAYKTFVTFDIFLFLELSSES